MLKQNRHFLPGQYAGPQVKHRPLRLLTGSLALSMLISIAGPVRPLQATGHTVTAGTAATAEPVQTAGNLPVLALSASAEATRGGTQKTIYDQVKAGDPVNVLAEFYNASQSPLNRVKVEVVADDQPTYFSPLPGAQEEDVSFNIGPAAKAKIDLQLLATKDLKAGTYTLRLRLTAEDFNPVIIPVTVTVRAKAVSDAGQPAPGPTKQPTVPANSSHKTGPASIDPGKDGSADDAPTFSPADFSNVGFGSSAGGFDGSDLSGPGGNGGSEAVKNKPKLIISNYKLDPEMAEAGKEFKLDLTFSNTNAKKEVRNIKITLNGEPGVDTAGAGRSGTAAPSSNLQTGSVFSPVGSSNTFFIDTIAAKGDSQQSITMKVMPNAAAQNYVMNVQFEYEDADGNEFRATEMIGIPVVQQAKMEAGEISLDPLSAGMPGAVNLDFFNTGKDSLSTFMVTLEGKGFTSENGRYFIGNFAPGQSDHFSAMITADEPGPLKGEVVFTFEDSAGKQHRETVPFETVVEEGIPGGPEADEDNAQLSGTGKPLLPRLMIGILGIAAAVAILLVFIRRKKQKNKKDLVIHD